MALSINEKTTSYLSMSFKDKNGVLAIPTTITYRIDCLTNNTVILTDTVFGVPATVVELTITPSQNSIINTANSVEKRRVTVIATYGVSNDSVTNHYDYNLKNLSGIS